MDKRWINSAKRLAKVALRHGLGHAGGTKIDEHRLKFGPKTIYSAALVCKSAASRSRCIIALASLLFGLVRILSLRLVISRTTEKLLVPVVQGLHLPG